MFKIDIDDGIVVKQKKLLEAALSSNPDTERKIRAMVRKVLKDAREEIIRCVRFANGDPRQSIQAIRRITYKQILGGNVNIYNRRKASGSSAHGNTSPRPAGSRQRSTTTQRILDYGPLDRGFILRFVNQGTTRRTTAYGNRGSISPRNFFGSAGAAKVSQAAERLSRMIDDELLKMSGEISGRS